MYWRFGRPTRTQIRNTNDLLNKIWYDGLERARIGTIKELANLLKKITKGKIRRGIIEAEKAALEVGFDKMLADSEDFWLSHPDHGVGGNSPSSGANDGL